MNPAMFATSTFAVDTIFWSFIFKDVKGLGV